MITITRSQLTDRPRHFSTYIDVVPEGSLERHLCESQDLASQIDIVALEAKQHWAYASGKWSVNGVVQHLIDAERIFAYRALRFARGDTTPLPGFDEEAYGRSCMADERDFLAILDEFVAVREASIHLFDSFTAQALAAMGSCNGIEISVASLGFVIVGHQQHHVNVLRERYLSG